MPIRFVDSIYCKSCGHEALIVNESSTLAGEVPCPVLECGCSDHLAMATSVYSSLVGPALPLNDPVNHPAHYTTGAIEVADFIADKDLNFFRGNAVKYAVRAGIKDPTKEVEDLEKAIWYLNREVTRLKEEKKKEKN